jgi:glycosyltransferase 2 family protein
MSQGKRRHLWLAVKSLLAIAIVIGVARHFTRILTDSALDSVPFTIRYELLIPAGLFYLLAHCFWGTFWVRLLHGQHIPVSWYAGLRCYFVSQFGKYVPGKAWVILMRVGMLRHSVHAHPIPVAVTATYETLSSMAAGALLAVLFLPYLGVLPVELSGRTTALLAVAALPLGLGLLNKLAVRIAKTRRGPDARPLPAPSLWLLAQGLLHGACGWCLLGLSLALVIRAVTPWSGALVDTYPADLGAVATSYVAGFVALVAPGGLGIREWVLQITLAPRFTEQLGNQAAAALAVIIALVLRLTWTVAEVVLALTLYFIHPRPQSHTHA